MTSLRFHVALLGAFGLAGVAGCGGCRNEDAQTALKSAVRRANDTNGKRLATLYCRYQGQFFSGPRNEEDFKNFIAARSAVELDDLGLSAETVDGVFVSERDKKPFFIRYGLKFSPGATQAIVFETQGVGDRVLVAFYGPNGPKVASVPIAQLEDYRNGKKDEAGGEAGPGPPMVNAGRK